ncbi:MAG: hypothetical protein II507_01580, partial [Treponema sp.]|nr:hypothetical protein [Treponema sp.]
FWNDFCGNKSSLALGQGGEGHSFVDRGALLSSLLPGIPADFENLDLETLEFEYLMMALRTLEGVNDAEYARRFASLEPWKGNLKKRLWENPLWKEFDGKKMCLSRESECGGMNFALSREGLLFLNSLLRNF